MPTSVGLGLTVARKLARLMEGDLVYRQEDGLTSFVLSLPPLERARPNLRPGCASS